MTSFGDISHGSRIVWLRSYRLPKFVSLAYALPRPRRVLWTFCLQQLRPRLPLWRQIHLNGGEPALHPQFLEIADLLLE